MDRLRSLELTLHDPKGDTCSQGCDTGSQECDVGAKCFDTGPKCVTKVQSCDIGTMGVIQAPRVLHITTEGDTGLTV